MCNRMEAAEQARNALQVGLAEAERSTEALWEKNTHLEAQLQKAEETGAELQADLRSIQEEKEELQEKLSETRHQQEAASAQLEQLHLEARRQEEVLAREVQEKEALVRERAALEVRLQAVQRDRQDLSEQLLGLRGHEGAAGGPDSNCHSSQGSHPRGSEVPEAGTGH